MFFFCALIAMHPVALVRAESGLLQPIGLLVESQANPVGVVTTRPAFAWNLLSLKPTARNLRQSAYRIVVDTSPSRLMHSTDLLWDSGRIVESTYWQRPYLGPALQPHTTYYWKVETWDGGDQQGPWSEVAHFTTSLLSPSDWTARWIAAMPDRPQSVPTLENQGVVLSSDPPPLPVFRHDILVKKSIVSAILSVAGLGQYEVHLNGKNVTETVMNPGWTDYRKTVSFDTYDVTKLLRRSSNTLAVVLGNGMYNVEA
jgi:alpha-L-rhamnosidase